MHGLNYRKNVKIVLLDVDLFLAINKIYQAFSDRGIIL